MLNGLHWKKKLKLHILLELLAVSSFQQQNITEAASSEQFDPLCGLNSYFFQMKP